MEYGKKLPVFSGFYGLNNCCQRSHPAMRAIVLLVAFAAASGMASAQAPMETADPLKAFVFDEYPRGSDYFLHGTRDTVFFRCVADLDRDGQPDLALSERSIWGNRTGPFEIFVRTPNGRYRYGRTADYESELKPACATQLESCSSNEYLSSGTCQWKKGFSP